MNQEEINNEEMMECEDYAVEIIPDYGPHSQQEILQNNIMKQARIDECLRLLHRRRLCAELRNVNRRFRNSTISWRFLGAMMGEEWYQSVKPSFVRQYR